MLERLVLVSDSEQPQKVMLRGSHLFALTSHIPHPIQLLLRVQSGA